MNGCSRNIPGLTSLRGLAAIWVFVRHYTGGTEGNGFWSDIAFHGGANGVMIFFVLSGFILSHVYTTQFADGIRSRDYMRFIYFRFARIYPLHLFVLILWFALFAVLMPRPGLPDMTSYTFALNLSLAHAWGLFQNYSWNAPSWTISVEWALYFVFPFALALIIRLRQYWVPVAVIGATIPVLHFMTESDFGVSYLITYGLMFTCGTAAYPIAISMVERSFDLFGGSLFVIVGVGLLIYTCSIGDQFWLTTLAATFLVIGLYAGNGVGHLLFGNRIMVFLGEISYSLYMTHIMVLILLPPDLPAFVWPPAVAIAVATATYFAVERPSRAGLRGLWQMRQKSTAPLRAS